MKKPIGEELDALDRLKEYVVNLQRLLRKEDPKDRRIARLHQIQMEVQTCLDGKNLIPLEDINYALGSVVQDYRNDGNFEDALERVEDTIADRGMSIFLDEEIIKRQNEGKLFDSLDDVESDEPEELNKTDTAKNKKAEPVSSKPAAVVSAQRGPVPPSPSDNISDAELKRRAKEAIRGRVSSPPPEKKVQAPRDLSVPSKISDRELGAMARELILQSQQREVVATVEVSNKVGPVQDMKNALDELSKSFKSTPFNRDFKNVLENTIMEAKKGNSAADVLEKLLGDVKDKKVLSSKEGDIIKKLMNTDGVKRAVSDPDFQTALRDSAQSLPQKSRKLILSELPPAFERPSIVKK